MGWVWISPAGYSDVISLDIILLRYIAKGRTDEQKYLGDATPRTEDDDAPESIAIQKDGRCLGGEWKE